MAVALVTNLDDYAEKACPIKGCSQTFPNDVELTHHLRNDSHREKRLVKRSFPRMVENSLMIRLSSATGRFVCEFFQIPFKLCIGCSGSVYGYIERLDLASTAFMKNDVRRGISLGCEVPFRFIGETLYAIFYAVATPFIAFHNTFNRKEREKGWETTETLE